MNREGAETYLRLLAEALIRGSLAAVPGSAWAEGPADGRTRMMAVGHALTAVGALGIETLEDIVADFDLAVNVRQQDQAAGREPRGGAPLAVPSSAVAGVLSSAAVGRWAARLHPARSAPLARASGLVWGWREAAEAAEAEDLANPETPDRFVPVGLSLPFRQESVSGELYLVSFAQTGSGARFIAAWPNRALARLGMLDPDSISLEWLTVTDDRGARYDLALVPGGGPGWAHVMSVWPPPPQDIRWLDIAAPPGPAVRVRLERQAPDAGDEPEVTEARLSPGEHLLTMLADRLLTTAPESWRDWRRQRAMASPGPLPAMTAGLGQIVAALEAADVLSPLSPVPARLAALCASMGFGGHGIAAAPAPDLPERWLSLLAHYQRRKPGMAPVRDGYAAVAAALPELDGIRLALLGLDNTEGCSSLHVLARGMTAEGQPGPLGVDLDFPLSLWLRDSGGRWHAARTAGRHRADTECVVRLRLVPPLPESADSIEVLAGGRSAEVRARLPLRWGCPT